MNICIPVTEDNGTASPVSRHFGSAPLFLIVDTDSGACRAVPNRNQHHSHGMCMPLASLAGERIDGMVVGGIGMGALSKLGRLGHPGLPLRARDRRGDAGRLQGRNAEDDVAGHGLRAPRPSATGSAAQRTTDGRKPDDDVRCLDWFMCLKKCPK